MPFKIFLQCVYSKWAHLENTNQSHYRTKIEKINKRRISQSALGKVHLLRRGGPDEDVLKKAHIFTGPLLRLLVNFRCPPPRF